MFHNKGEFAYQLSYSQWGSFKSSNNHSLISKELNLNSHETAFSVSAPFICKPWSLPSKRSTNLQVFRFNPYSGRLKGRQFFHTHVQRQINFVLSFFISFFLTKVNFFLYSSRETIQQYISHDRIQLTSLIRHSVAWNNVLIK